jgi:anti-sigma B factor antagonist
MEINIKTLQVTEVEVAVSIDTAHIPPVQEQQSVHVLQQVTVIEIEGELNYNTAALVEAKVLPLAQPKAKLLLDMSKVPYLSSAGLRLLLSLYRQVVSNNGQIVLVGIVEEIKETMSITGFLNFFMSRDTHDAGLEALNVKLAV